MADRGIAFGTADLTNCDREPIHVPGSVQPHGALLVLEPDSFRVVQAGGNSRAFLDASPAELLGTCLLERLSRQHAEQLRAMAAFASRLDRQQQVFSLTQNTSINADVLIHWSDEFLVLELEPRLEDDPHDSLALVQSMVQRVQAARTTAEAYLAIVDEVRNASGFERVMLYRFLSDGSGSVEAEARSPEVDSYLGLRYPASDIPQQARALYVRNWIRLIGDARYTPAPLMAFPDWPQNRLLDLSQSSLRSVSPIHLEYLANMGVIASMSVSIVIGGKLWGLIACHHRTPRFPSHKLRVALELFAQMISFSLDTKLEAEQLGSRLRQKSISEEMISDLSNEPQLAEGLKRFQPKLLEYIPAAGVALWIDGQFNGVGELPKRKNVASLVRWLNETLTEGVFSTHRLSSHYPPAASFANTASGILALSVSRSPRDYVIWFRPELVQTVTWAGNPQKPVEGTAQDTRLSPRKSFEHWKQEVHLQSEPWSPLDLKTAESLRLSLLEVVLQHTDQLARERERARVQQQALLAELDNRILQWEAIAQELRRESDRRAVVEAELSQVLRQTVLEQEAERQRIARELHDSLGQYLTVVRLDLDSIGREAGASDSIRQRVEKLKNLTADVGQEVNQIAWEIRPTSLDDLGLQRAFQQYLEEWAERSTLQFDIHLALSDRRLSPHVETVLYRVLQEAIRNVVAHAGAKRVGVVLEATAKEVQLIIEDDGKGFVWDGAAGNAGPSARLGLLGVRERLALVGGSLEIESAPGAGTTLLIHVPL